MIERLLLWARPRASVGGGIRASVSGGTRLGEREGEDRTTAGTGEEVEAVVEANGTQDEDDESGLVGMGDNEETAAASEEREEEEHDDDDEEAEICGCDCTEH